MNEKGGKTMIYIGDNLPNHDHLEENREGTIMKQRWRAVKRGQYWSVEMKISEQLSAILMKELGKEESAIPLWEEALAQAMAVSLNESENENPWIVVVVGDGYAAARNGKDGLPEMGCHYFSEWEDAQQEADRYNKAVGITDAPRFDGEW